jgi:phosphinothricin acetyltransferase
MRLIHCTEVGHAPAILAIFNEAIAHSTALWEYQPRPPQAMAAWFATKRDNGFPVIGLENDKGDLMGFASWGHFRAFAAYKYTVEHSIYVHQAHRGRGVGRVLLEKLIVLAREREIHMMVGGIDATNAASIGLHLSLGFEHAGTLKQAGFKFGRWLDLAFYQRVLDTPEHPVDG